LGEFLERTNRLRPPYNDYSNSLLSYNLTTNHWKVEDLKLRKRAYHNIIYNKNEDKIYVLESVRLSRNKRFEYLDEKIEVLTVRNKTVEIDKTNPHKAANAASFVYKGNIIVMGGITKKKQDGKSVFSNKIHVYDTKSGFWYELNNMPIAKELNGILVNDKIYVFGGNNGKH
jgi:N-acetylneuraminic acid mutarotase